MKITSPRIIFAGGGTGGHLFPGLAVAERLVEELPGVRITFAGTGRDFERQHVREAGFDYLTVPSHPMPRRPWRLMSFVIENLRGYRSAQRFLREQRVAAVVGLGGYASAPMARAAVRRGVPLVLLEQNVVPGRTTRWLAPSATFLCVATEATVRHLDSRCPMFVTGNPIRAAFSCSPRPLAGEGPGVRAAVPGPRPVPGEALAGRQWHPGKTASESSIVRYVQDDSVLAQELQRFRSGTDQPPTRQLLVLGGSGGAQSLNESVPRALAKASWALPGWRIVHQTGPGNAEATRQLYRSLQIEAAVVPFVADMASILAGTDLAVCRAGGTTLAELAAMGVPAILLPYPHAADDHQRKNADWFATSEGCLVLDERKHATDLVAHLADTLGRLLADDAGCQAMSRAIHSLARPDAAGEVAGLIGQLVGGVSFARR
jgi:UDP-N-acetylglucosamine--N-acetylmuramyl-(pentapeptide) pyrophosphoryl-undecaprenol N-acetylglucosamine transferase